MHILFVTLSICRLLAWMLYVGVVVSFAILQLFSQTDTENYLLWFRKMGVILGLSLGATILPSIVIRWLETGSYYPLSSMEGVAFSVGFALWVSNIILEIWTLDPIRKFDLNLLDESLSIEQCRQKAVVHIRLQALLSMGTTVCFWLAYNLQT